MESIHLEIPGMPFGKQRPQVNNAMGTVFTPGQTIRYEDFIKFLFMQNYPDFEPFGKDEPLELWVNAEYPIPGSWSLKKQKEAADPLGNLFPTVKPDFDNVAKIIADGLNKVAYYDDKQIVDCIIKKRYTTRSPRVVINIRTIRILE